MGKSQSRFRRPDADEQHVLDHLTVRLVQAEEQERFDALLVEHHYLHSAVAVGEQLRYTWPPSGASGSGWRSGVRRRCICGHGIGSSGGVTNSGGGALD